jgi:hypothetical protein
MRGKQVLRSHQELAWRPRTRKVFSQRSVLYASNLPSSLTGMDATPDLLCFSHR